MKQQQQINEQHKDSTNTDNAIQLLLSSTQVEVQVEEEMDPDDMSFEDRYTFSSGSGSTSTSDDTASNDKIAALILSKAQTATANCESYGSRVDLYSEAAERGSAEVSGCLLFCDDVVL